jgi:CDP-6-deoxy-D-xylo-4-hexulose-3-dehydrase
MSKNIISTHKNATFNWPLQKNTIGLQEKLALIGFILKSDRFTNGPQCLDFEKAWTKWQGRKYSLFVSSGTTANTLLLDAVRDLYFSKKTKLKILCPAVNWATNISTFKQQGHDIFFYDIDYNTYSPTYSSLKRYYQVGLKPDIIYATHIMGFANDLREVKKYWPEAIVLEDCCESHGALTRDKHKVGNEGLGSTFSFYFGHHMTTIEGGMVSTDDEDLYNLMRAKRSHGMAREMTLNYRQLEERLAPDIDPMFLFPTEGYNFRNTELGAVLGLVQLKKLDSFIKQRKENYCVFLSTMIGHPWIKSLPDPTGNSAMTLPFHCVSPEKKQILKDRLIKLGVETRPFLVGNLLKQPFMSDFKQKPYLPNSEEIHTHAFYIGNNHFVTEEQIYKLSKELHKCAA